MQLNLSIAVWNVNVSLLCTYLFSLVFSRWSLSRSVDFLLREQFLVVSLSV